MIDENKKVIHGLDGTPEFVSGTAVHGALAGRARIFSRLSTSESGIASAVLAVIVLKKQIFCRLGMSMRWLLVKI